jgi:hypothetical protein
MPVVQTGRQRVDPPVLCYLVDDDARARN